MNHTVPSRIANDVNDVNNALFYFIVASTFRVWVPRNKIKDDLWKYAGSDVHNLYNWKHFW